jgi:hypothetical protein
MHQQAAKVEAQAAAEAAASGSAPPAAAAQQQHEQEEPLLGQQRFGTTGFQHAGWPAKATYTFVAPLLRRGAQNQVQCGVGGCGALPPRLLPLLFLLSATCWSLPHLCAWVACLGCRR